MVAGPGATADASPLSDAIARHGAADVTALRARRADVAARCTLGAVHARRNDLPRAALYLTDCDDAALPDDVAVLVRAAVRDIKRRLDASRYSALDVLSHPEGLTAEIDALPGESFTTPARVWIAPGNHQIRATFAERSWTQRITTEPHKNASIMIETGLTATPSAPRRGAIDFSVDEPGGALGEHLTAPPPDIKHPSLLSDKYRGVAQPSSDASVGDPLASRAAPVAARPLWLGARLGVGMFDDATTSARAGFAVAVAARYRISDAAFLAARADWTRRGGETMTGTIDVLGASAGLGATVVGRAQPSTRAHERLAVALLAQLRADLRLANQRDDTPVRRAGLGIAAGAELALPSTPFTLGLRFEQGLTELVAGSRDRSLLAEVGIDLR
jgi:hypothetical protein